MIEPKFTQESAKTMYEALQKITGMDPGEYEEEFSSMRDITVSCYRCEEMQDIALEALKKVEKEEKTENE